jgi:hypothetical protein
MAQGMSWGHIGTIMMLMMGGTELATKAGVLLLVTLAAWWSMVHHVKAWWIND